jgi:hypothetical protein
MRAAAAMAQRLKISLMGAKKEQIYGDTNANTQEKWKPTRMIPAMLFLMKEGLGSSCFWRDGYTLQTLPFPNRLVRHNSILIYICYLLKDTFLQLIDNDEGKKKEV